MIKEILNHKVFFKLRLRFIKCNYSANGTKKILYFVFNKFDGFNVSYYSFDSLSPLMTI